MSQALPLQGIRVIDYSHFLAGPYVGRCLAALGAEVIKVERPGSGDAGRQHRLDELKARGRWPWQRQQLRHPLALVHAARLSPDLGPGAAEQSVVLGFVERQQFCVSSRPLRSAEVAPVVILLRLPRVQSGLDLLRVLRRVPSQLEGVLTDDRRRLVVLATAVAVRPQTEDDVRADHPDQANVVRGDLVTARLLERLLD